MKYSYFKIELLFNHPVREVGKKGKKKKKRIVIIHYDISLKTYSV